MIYVQRSALGEGGESLNVELQANTLYSKVFMGEEKSWPYRDIGMTYDLPTLRNGGARN